ncbi:MAG: HAMP domain-containing histidine kinase, partial [Dehalococcoidia bacterium]|nr:HAMP domain-containing histidine kinase [Dehalococcoidia bacterium]
PPNLGDLRVLDIERDYEGETADVFLLVFRADGALVGNPNNVEAEEFVEEGFVRSALQGEPVWATVKEHGNRMRILATPVVTDGRVEGVVLGGRSLEAHDRQLSLLLWVLGGTGAVGLILAGVGGYFVAGRALRPITSAYERQRTFVGDASHELRSPLAVIRASSELLLREPLTESQRESVSDINETSIEAAELVEDLLLLARLDRGGAPATDAVCDAAEVVEEVLRQLAPLIERHGSEVRRSGGSVPVRCGESALRRVLRALVENVLAHTPRGTPFEISTRLDGDDAVIVVRDHGPGVPPAALPTLFDPFTRVSEARTPTEGHSGLGLTIALRLLERCGGTLGARNHPAGGLEISVRLRHARE